MGKGQLRHLAAVILCYTCWWCSGGLSNNGALPDQELLDSLDHDLRYAITVEGKMAMEDVENYEEVRREGNPKTLNHMPQP